MNIKEHIEAYTDKLEASKTPLERLAVLSEFAQFIYDGADAIDVALGGLRNEAVKLAKVSEENVTSMRVTVDAIHSNSAAVKLRKGSEMMYSNIKIIKNGTDIAVQNISNMKAVASFLPKAIDIIIQEIELLRKQ